MKGLYKFVKELVSNEDAKELVFAIENHADLQPCNQVNGSKSIYSFTPGNTLLGLLNDKISKLTGKKLKPAYSFVRVYSKGNELIPHKDRESCEYSVTINLFQSHPWAIYMGNKAIMQNIGDGVIYKGCEIEHSRKPFEGEKYIQIFLHYVDSGGPNKKFAYDLHNCPQQPLTLSFTKTNPNLTNYYRVSKFFSIDECNALTNANFDLTDGLTGQGHKSEIRKSKLFWIPMTSVWIDLYTKILHAVGNINDEFFKFDITRMTESIQYTEYDSSYNGHYGWHYDVGQREIDSNRKLSIVIQLTDPSNYKGGELQIVLGDDKDYNVVEKDQGTLIIFPSYLRHRVTPVTEGKRCSLVTWINGPPFK